MPLGESEWKALSRRFELLNAQTQKALAGLTNVSGAVAAQQAALASFENVVGAVNVGVAMQEHMAVLSQSIKGGAFGPPEQRDALARIIREATAGLTNTEWLGVLNVVRETPAEVIGSPELALDQVVSPLVPEVDLHTPDGFAALPTVVEGLPPSRRVDLLVRLVALLVSAALLAKAFAESEAEFRAFAEAMIALGLLYAALLGAIEHAEKPPRQ